MLRRANTVGGGSTLVASHTGSLGDVVSGSGKDLDRSLSLAGASLDDSLPGATVDDL